MRSSFASSLGQPRRTARRIKTLPVYKERQQQRAFQDLRESRTKPSTQGMSVRTVNTDNNVSSYEEIVSVLSKARRSKCSSAKRRRNIARSLGLEKTLFLPKEYLRLKVKENLTIFTNPYTGKVYGKTEKVIGAPERHVYTRNIDAVPDMIDIGMKISRMQALLHPLVKVEISAKAVRLLRRVSIVFSGLPEYKFRMLVGAITRESRAKLLKESLETLPRRRPKPVRAGDYPRRFRRGVVNHPRYGDIPILIAKDRTGEAAKPSP